MSNEKDAKSVEIDLNNLTDEQKKVVDIAQQIRKIMEDNNCEFQVNHAVNVIPKPKQDN